MFKYRDCTYSLTTHLEISANKPKLNWIWFLAGRRPFSHVAEKLSAKIPVRRSAAWLKSELHDLIFVRGQWCWRNTNEICGEEQSIQLKFKIKFT